MAPESDEESDDDATVDNSYQEELHGECCRFLSPYSILFTFFTPICGIQEYRQFCKYVNALISRSTKLSDLAVDLESHSGAVDAGSAVGKRLNKLYPQNPSWLLNPLLH